MLRFFERRLEPTGRRPTRCRRCRQPACRLAVLLAFRAADPGAAAGAVRHRFPRCHHRCRDSGLHRPHRLADIRAATRDDLAGSRPPARVDGGAAAGREAGHAHRADHRRQPDPGPGIDQPRALAEPLACRAAGLDILPERFCRPHCRPRHATGPALRESVISSITGLWYIVVYGPARAFFSQRPIGCWPFPCCAGSRSMPPRS